MECYNNEESFKNNSKSFELITIKSKNKEYYLILKRILDIILSMFFIIILIPLFICIGILIKIDSKGPIIFKHKRLGKNGKKIFVYKFRSMFNGAENKLKDILKNDTLNKEWRENYKLNDDPRITRFGRILRKTSLDELPQLFNVLKGDMSLIGPRPIIEEELELYGFYDKRFLSVLPGITGWWACNGRNDTTYEERKWLELYYIENIGLKIDLKCFFKTVYSVFRKIGVK